MVELAGSKNKVAKFPGFRGFKENGRLVPPVAHSSKPLGAIQTCFCLEWGRDRGPALPLLALSLKAES
jgi:hypothetical protein